MVQKNSPPSGVLLETKNKNQHQAVKSAILAWGQWKIAHFWFQPPAAGEELQFFEILQRWYSLLKPTTPPLLNPPQD